ncbi:MAG: MogA/MoaB family molybdenum cofactor biosynthesis protein [Sphaerobacteraceae bacterium]|nr:MAG: MogA/MoaB family molybdenum cofactor biosynthesis protein [Sphaerobacteraceae bacterium]
MSASTQEHREQAPESINCAVVTVSDTRTEETDKSGKIIKDVLAQAGHQIIDYRIIPDEPDQIGPLLDELASRSDSDAIIFNGGTGIAPRDTTFDVIDRMLEKKLDGFGELFRWLSWYEIGPAAMLSRATAGTYKNTLVFLTPGSSNAVNLAMEKLIGPEVAHMVFEVRK